MWEYQTELTAVQQALRESGFPFAAGLSELELSRVESEFGFQFPPDLRWILGKWLPRECGCPDWRDDSEENVATLHEWMASPGEEIGFRVAAGNFWREEWGQRPNCDEAAGFAVKWINEDAPRLIPIRAHSYLPSEPCETGNPVFSVHDTDIIHRGRNLAARLRLDLLDEGERMAEPVYCAEHRVIPFWTQMVRENCLGEYRRQRESR